MAKVKNNNKLDTSAEIARQLNCAVWRVRYAIRSRKIKAAVTSGNVKLYNANAVKLMKSVINTK